MAITFELELPAGDDRPELARADLTFYGLDHSGPSYQVRVFFNNPNAGPDTPLIAGRGVRRQVRGVRARRLLRGGGAL